MEKLLALIVLATACATAQAEPTIIGQWKSDKELTMQFNKERARLEDKTINFLSQIMGRMTVTFTKTTVTYEMNDWEFETQTGDKRPFKGFREVSPYKQIGHTPKSVAIRAREPVTGEESITVINFVNPSTIWVYTGRTGELTPTEHLREYFVRQQP